MHICLPDTREIRPAQGGSFTFYNVHIDGLYHCSLRYKQLLHLHQLLAKQFATSAYNAHTQLPPFPPKKLLPLTVAQREERRQQLEKYLQTISQDKVISNSFIFNLFLLEAQRESTRLKEKPVHLDIELVNGQKLRLPILTHDSTDNVLTAVCRALNLNDRYHAYFCLCLCGYDVIRDKLIIKRRLSFFESPYITLQMAIQQQEQLLNVLSSSASFNTSTTTTTTSNDTHKLTNGNNRNTNNYIINQDNGNLTSCCCLDCCSSSTASRAHSEQQANLINSSSSTETNNNNNNNNINASCTNRYCNYHTNTRCVSTATTSNNNNNNMFNHSPIGSNTFVTHRILLRKSYWDPLYDTYLLNDQQALNLIFIQTVYDIKHSLMFVDKNTYHRLEELLAKDAKLEYISLARTLKYYNYVHFEPCISDYPRPGTKVMISIGCKELNMRVLKPTPIKRVTNSSTVPNIVPVASSSTSTSNGNSNTYHDETHFMADGCAPATSSQTDGEESSNVLYCTSSLVSSGYYQLITKDDLIEEEYNFKVPLIRCWRLTSMETLNNDDQQNCTLCASTTTSPKRKTLSLFNSIVGTNRSNEQDNDRLSCSPCRHTNGSSHHHTTITGTDGAKLMAALAGNVANRQRCCRRQRGDSTNSSHSSDLGSECNGARQMSSQQQQQQQQQHTPFSQYELSFEYLVSKNKLRWITISSDQAIFISVSLQGVVDELVAKREGETQIINGSSVASSVDVNNGGCASSPQPIVGTLVDGSTAAASAASSAASAAQQQQQQQQQRQPASESFTYMHRDGKLTMMNTNKQSLIDKFGTTLGYSPMNLSFALALSRQRQLRRRAALLTSMMHSAQQQHLHRQQQQINLHIRQQHVQQSPNSIISQLVASPFAATGGYRDMRGNPPIASSTDISHSSSSSFTSSPACTSASAPVASVISSSASLLLSAGRTQTNAFEIAGLKKAPSPIINDAFDGLTNDDDQM